MFKITLNVSDETNQRLNKLTAASASKDVGEVIAKAAALYEACVKVSGLNGQVLIRDEDGFERELEIE